MGMTLLYETVWWSEEGHGTSEVKIAFIIARKEIM